MRYLLPPRRWLLALAPLFLVISCENKELAAKRDAQKRQLLELENQISELQSQAQEAVPDHSSELADTLARIDATAAEMERLDTEADELRTTYVEEETALRAFKNRYPIRN